MTDPNNPYDPYGDQSGFGNQNNPNQNGGYGYQQNPNQHGGYGYQQNPNFNAGYQQNYDPGVGVGQPGGEVPPTSPVFSGPGEYRAMEPLSVAFKRLNSNFGAWVLFGIIGFLMIGVSYFASMPSDLSDPYSEPSNTGVVVSLLVSLLSLILTIFLYRGAFEEIDGRKPAIGDFFKVSRWGSIIGAYVLLVLVSILIAIPGSLVMVFGLISLIENNGAAGGALVFLGLVLLFVLVLAFIPVLTMVPLAVIDGRATVLQSFGFVWTALKPNFWKVLGTLIVLGIINFVGAMLCGLGMIYTMPLYSIAVVAMYRMVIGGRRPVPQA